MRSPAVAIAWEFRRRHRWGLAAVAGYVAALAAMSIAIGGHGLPLDLRDEIEFVVVVTIPASAALYYLLAVFSYGFAGDLAGRASVYPARMFALPVRSSALAGWPMLYGTTAMVILWVAVRRFGFWPEGVAVPVVWPGLLLAVAMAWTQALTWTPYGLRTVRAFLILTWLTLLAIGTTLAFLSQARELLMLAVLAPLLLLAYGTACRGVARARRGDVPDWRRPFARVRHLVRWRRRRADFTSPAQAQAWLEWQRHGRTLPALVAYLLPFELALLFAARGATALVLAILTGVCLTPPFMAAFVAAAVRKASPAERDGYGVTPFLATRPMSSAALVRAKLVMALRSTLATWFVLLLAVAAALRLSGTHEIVIALARQTDAAFGTVRAVTLAVLAVALLVATTWKQLVQSLYVGLSGRAWLVKGSVLLALVVVTVGLPLAAWVSERITVLVEVVRALPAILAVLAALKLSGAAWTTARLYDGALVGGRTLVIGTAAWLGVVLVLHGLFVWIIDTPYVPSYVLLLAAILVTPLVRVSAAPLALEWNRRR
jgi:hypothetical protein